MNTLKKALYISNNIFSHRLIQRLLEPQGYTVLQAKDGLEGIKMALDQPFDVILLEQYLPYLDGLSVATRLRGSQETNKTPIIAFTSKVSKGEQEKVLVSGCSGYIEKPLNPSNFAKKVEEIVSGHDLQAPSAQILTTYNAELVAKLQQKIMELKAKNELLLAHQQALQDAYKKARESHAELERLSRLKQHIVAITSHELRTPLSVSAGYLDALKETCFGPLNEEQESAIGLAQDSLKSIEDLIDRMAELNRVTHQKFPLKLKKLDLNHFIQKTVSNLKLFIQIRQFKLELNIGCEPIWIYATKNTLDQILTNLMKNAISYSPDGTTISIKSWSDNAYAYCSIKDQGIGIPPNELEHIFEGFYQLQDYEHHKSGSFEFMTRGVGVGLALCKGLLRELGGSIWAKSSGENSGSTFTFRIPIDRI